MGFPTEDEFDRLMREAEIDHPEEAFEHIEPINKTPQPKAVLTDEQKERMERNKRIAEEKRRARQLEAAEKRQIEATQKLTQKHENSDEDEHVTFVNDKTNEAPLSQVYEPAQKSPSYNQNNAMESEEKLRATQRSTRKGIHE